MPVLQSLVRAFTFMLLAVSAAQGCESSIENGSTGASGTSGSSTGASSTGASSSSASSTSGGTEDSCTGGDNMTDPRIEGGVEQGSIGAEIRILWDLGTGHGAELPSSYFDIITIEGSDAAAVAQAKHTAPMEITVTFADLAASLAIQSSLSFTLVFPDRREHIACSHPGMPDRYLLDVTLTFDQNSQIESSELTQHVQLGDI